VPGAQAELRGHGVAQSRRGVRHAAVDGDDDARRRRGAERQQEPAEQPVAGRDVDDARRRLRGAGEKLRVDRARHMKVLHELFPRHGRVGRARRARDARERVVGADEMPRVRAAQARRDAGGGQAHPCAFLRCCNFRAVTLEESWRFCYRWIRRY